MHNFKDVINEDPFDKWESMLKKKRREKLVVNKEQIATSKKMQEKVVSILSSNHPQFEIILYTR